jgi:hypothetical protein
MRQIEFSLNDEYGSLDICSNGPRMIQVTVAAPVATAGFDLSADEARAAARALDALADLCDCEAKQPAGPDVGLGRACEISDPLAAELCDGYSHAPAIDHSAAARWDGRSLEQVHRDAERYALESALAAHDGNISHTARALKTSRMTVYRLLDRTGLRPFGSHQAADARGVA